MPVFDDMLALEERLQGLEIELGKARDLVRQCSRRVLETKNQLQAVQKNMEVLRGQLKAMKDAPVVLLSEWEHVTAVLASNEDLLLSKQQEVIKLEKQGLETAKAVPSLEAQVRQMESQLDGFTQVIPFRR